ncbi:MAG: hypothetical protein ACJ8AT_17450 [Hyalangium sp.]|uniref:hypothetical protein n=1 Tax=Hyalangium sp. TaxID=2028555 RepID=UPI00389AD4AF
MKTKILVGAVAAFLFSGAALANDTDCPPGTKDTQSMNSQSMQDDRQAVIETQPVDQGIGGSGQVGTDQSLSGQDQSQSQGVSGQSSQEQGLGGSGTSGVSNSGASSSGVSNSGASSSGVSNSGVSNQGNNEMILRCQPVPKGTGTGGSGDINQPPSSDLGAGGSGYQSEPLRQPEAVPPTEVTPPAAAATPEPSSAFTPTAPITNENPKKEEGPGLRGLSVTLGGGVEGYSGALAPEINPGPAYGLQAAIRPSKVLGIELAYSGAVNSLDTRVLGGSSSGPDLVRNGGQAALTLGLAASQVQPYLMGGVGLSDYHFRGAAVGFRDDTVGNVPVGAGLRTQVGDFTADLRADYNFLFSQDFAVGVAEGVNENGRYTGTLNIGGTF